MPARGGGGPNRRQNATQPASHCWTEDGLPPLPKAKRKPRKPKRKKRFHQAFRVLIALGLIPTKSRQGDPLGLRLKRMQVVEAGGGGEKLLELQEAAGETNGDSPAAAQQDPLPDGGSSPQATALSEQATAKLEVEATEAVVVKQEEDEIPSAIKEEACSEQDSVTVTAASEETPLPRPATPKVEELSPAEQSAPAVEEVSRKRSHDKEPEGGSEGSSGSESESGRKKNRTEQETDTSNTHNGNRLPPAEDERERMISEFISEVSVSSDSISKAVERLSKEVEDLNELAAQKEMEWNAILRVKKLKEEMLERVLRRKRMNHFEGQFSSEPTITELNINTKNIPAGLQIPLRHPRLAEMGKLPQRPLLPKPMGPNYPPMPHGREGRNGPIVDVKSIIDDYSGVYRSRHPESPARRGRRVRGSAANVANVSAEQRFPSINPSLISMANMALGTGASVRTVSDYMALGGVDHSMGANKDGSGRGGPVIGGKQPGYPEVTLHPVSPPSLLHQVLTKQGPPPRPANFSPTLARLLTAPERPAPPPHFRPPPRVSIADILSSTKKSRNEITITPVSGNPGAKKDDVVCLDDDDGEPGDRLVIDEGNDDIPVCQGCRHKSAQFVCAGCGNQWYCSRECQVSAWEEHSDLCSG